MKKNNSRILKLPDSPEFRILQYPIHHYSSVSSTMDQAWKLGRKKELPGNKHHSILLIADTQEKGRGRHGRKWSSPEGGIWTSLFLSLPNQSPELFPHLTIAGALAIARTSKTKSQIQPRIRWPNDVVLRNSDQDANKQWLKYAGVLVESKQVGNRNIPAIVMGMGINVNIRREEMPPDIQQEATSLSEYTNKKWNIKQLYQEVLIQLDQLLVSFQRRNLHKISKEWEQYSAVLNKHVRIWTSNERYQGTVKSLSIEEGITIQLERGGFKILQPAHVQKLRLIN